MVLVHTPGSYNHVMCGAGPHNCKQQDPVITCYAQHPTIKGASTWSSLSAWLAQQGIHCPDHYTTTFAFHRPYSY